MNWLTDYVRPKIKQVFRTREMPENLWQKCDSCGQMIFHRDFEAQLHVCDNCGHHMKIGPDARFRALLDEGTMAAVEVPEPIADPLKFRDTKRYTDRLKDARSKTGFKDAATVVEGQMAGVPVVLAAHAFDFMGGSMGMAVGNALLAAAERAVALGAPLIAFPAAGGARMQEGILSLMQMPRTTVAVEMLREAGLPFIVVLTDPTTGGVTASYAMLGDIQIAEPGALICFAGPRVIEQTIREKLPEGFQRAEYLLDHGMLDMVVDRRQMRETLTLVVEMLMRPVPLPLLDDAEGAGKSAAGRKRKVAAEKDAAGPSVESEAAADAGGEAEARSKD
ncbi:MAG: acetyl-CoA carboxylase, carboxyltransferase subunit beta [Alphaproteobacteria bacterium]|nr:acetyl-CoA carboxylase, carboxyltransferase subunit beta [Alphaproteobacteria bacterium]MDX5369272.1 acetyl-CoA carboxylase, carboxyltransferase subunit beta [Alphaproteobacteria bacterium]MDX5463957.1 acetyl-CoA carboxylase, carboxyltransferase subunit beta [Alphaproteobacteria bacterium]